MRPVKIAVCTLLVSVVGVSCSAALHRDPLSLVAGQSVLGCWNVRALGWDAGPQIPQSGVLVRFDTASASENNPELRNLQPLVHELARGPLAFSWWGVEQHTGRIIMILGDGLGMYRIVSELRGQRMSGKARWNDEAPLPWFHRGGPVEAVRAECPE
jgi:hypothetical protein